MSIFKSKALTWWQMSIFKVALLALGLAAGAYWSEIFRPWLVPLLILAVAGGVYIKIVWSRD